MPGTPTPNYNLIIGTIGGDKDIWGTQRNDNMDAIDTQMKVNEDAAATAQTAADDAQTGADASAKIASTNTFENQNTFEALTHFGQSIDLSSEAPGNNRRDVTVTRGDLGTANFYVDSNGKASIDNGDSSSLAKVGVNDDDTDDGNQTIMTRQKGDRRYVRPEDNLGIVFNGTDGGPEIAARGLSFVRTAEGRYTISFDTEQLDNKYNVQLTTETHFNNLVTTIMVAKQTLTTTEFDIIVRDAAPSYVDPTRIFVTVSRLD